MLVRRFPRTAKIMASRPSAPTSATAPTRWPKKVIRKIVICPCRQKKTAFAAWLRMRLDHRFAVFRVFFRMQVDYPGRITTQNEILQQECT